MSPVAPPVVRADHPTDLTDDLAVAPLDGVLVADARFEEEVDLFAWRDGRLTAGCSFTGGATNPQTSGGTGFK